MEREGFSRALGARGLQPSVCAISFRMPRRSRIVIFSAVFVSFASWTLAQETPTEREAARDVLKKMAALEQSLDVPGAGRAG